MKSTPDVMTIINEGRTQPVTDIDFKSTEEFPEVLAWGPFAHDRGHQLEEIIVGSKSMLPEPAARAALALQQWDQADGKTREQLGRAWVKNILLGFSTPLEEPTSAFAKQGKSFQPITATSEEDGGVTVRVWVQGPIGMQPILKYDYQEYTFSPQGEISPKKTLEHFEASILG